MASGDVFESIKPRDFIPQNGVVYDPTKPRQVGQVFGYPLRKAANDGFYCIVRLASNGTPMSTGLTIQVLTVDDPNNADPGKVFQLGVSGARLVSNTTNVGTVAMGAEVTANVTANAASGVVTATSIAIPKASLGNPPAGELLELFIRRVGTASADTHSGEVLVLGVVASDT